MTSTSGSGAESADIVVIGGGIAGVSAAYALSAHPRRPSVHLVESEAQLAHHTTGRSAAQYIVNYGTAPTRALTVAALPFFRHTPDGLVDAPLLTERGVLSLATDDQEDLVAANVAEDGLNIHNADNASSVERYTLSEDGRRLHMQFSLTDPVMFREPLVLERTRIFTPEVDLLDAPCEAISGQR